MIILNKEMVLIAWVYLLIGFVIATIVLLYLKYIISRYEKDETQLQEEDGMLSMLDYMNKRTGNKYIFILMTYTILFWIPVFIDTIIKSIKKNK